MARESLKTRGFAGAAMAATCLSLPAPAMADVLQIGAAGAEWVAGGPPALSAPLLIDASPAPAVAPAVAPPAFETPTFETAVFEANTFETAPVAAAAVTATPLAASQYAPTRVDEASGVVFIGESAPASFAVMADTPLTVDGEIHPLSITQALDAAGPTRWRARVAQLAAKYDISPALLEAVVWQESRWNERAISPVGARGLAQLMPGTAAQMGVDPGDPMANLEGGARYLRMQLDAFEGNVEKALAAYNAGPARVLRAGGIPNIRETREYVAAIIARLAAPMRQ